MTIKKYGHCEPFFGEAICVLADAAAILFYMDDRNTPAVYIVTNIRNTVLYVGVTHALVSRIQQHKEKQIPGFTKRYNVDKLVYFEYHKDIRDAIEREKQIKAGSREKKIELIESINPLWKDLYYDLIR